MIKKLFFMAVVTVCPLAAMEHDPHKAPGLSKSSNGATRVRSQADTALMHSADNVLEHDPIGENTKAWGALIKRAYHVMQHGTVREQDAFFDAVIEQTNKGRQQKIDTCKHQANVIRLEAMAIFFKHHNLAHNAGAVWQQLAQRKDWIDGLKFENITVEDQTAIIASQKYPMVVKCGQEESCMKSDKLCRDCTKNVDSSVKRIVINGCCAQDLSAGVVCEVCGDRLKHKLEYDLRKLVTAFHLFGLPLEKPEHKQLVKWVIMYKSSIKKPAAQSNVETSALKHSGQYEFYGPGPYQLE